MEENVALDSSKQKQFVKSIKGIKKLIKKNDAEGARVKISAAKVKDGKIQKKKRSPRGLVYLGHIPHGFYENQMTQYFKQFGMVTNVRVIRSKRTGISKGFAFVEFKEPAVAEIVAETMNNYLMGKRLIKAAYIPPEKQKLHATRKFWSRAFNPGSEGRLKMKKAYNANKDEKGDLGKARKLLANITKTKKKLSELGINYDFFTPVDVPESLIHLVSKPEVKQEKESKVVKEKKVKEQAKKPQPKIESQAKQGDNKKGKKSLVEKGTEKTELKKKATGKVEIKPEVKSKHAKNPIEVNKKEQKQIENKLKEAGVKPVENFIKIQQESGDESDSSYDFNSDEYEKMLNDENSSDLSENDKESGNEDSEEESEEASDEDNPPLLVPARKVVPHIKPQKRVKKEEKAPRLKRQASQKPIVETKKSKFENKSTQKLAKKQFKKKK